MEQDKLNCILSRITQSEHDLLGIVYLEKDTFELLYDKKNLVDTKAFDSYQSYYEYLESKIISDTQKEIYSNLFSPCAMSESVEQDSALSKTVHIQIASNEVDSHEWVSLTRYDVSDILESDNTFLLVADTITIKTAPTLEFDAMRTALQNHFEFILGGSIETDCIKYFNHSFQNSFLASSPSTTYSGFIDEMMTHIHPEDSDIFYHAVNPENVYEQLKDNKSINTTIRYQTDNGYVWYNITICRFHDDLNTNIHFLFIVYDATKQREEELRHYEELRWALEKAEKSCTIQNNFINSISHEIRNPLNGIQTVAKLLLQKKELSITDIHKYARIIQESGDYLHHIVNSILLFSNLSSDTFPFIEEDYNITKLITNLQKFVSSKKKRNVSFSLNTDEMLPSTLYGDESHLEQAICNVIDNAFKYTSSGSVSIDISWKSDYPGEGILAIDVTDTGIGIKPEQEDTIFQVFWQSDRESPMNCDSIGMGLPITKMMLERMGGSITFDSIYGKGTTFHITIPQTVLDNQPFGTLLEHEEDLYAGQIDSIARKHFLVVDDSDMNLQVMQVVLDELGASTALCKSGKEAIELLEQEQTFDMIFMDHFMPDMDGIETTRYIRNMNSSFCKKVPIVAFTANTVKNAKKMYQDEGMNDILLKPVDVKQLKKLMKKWLN